MRNEPIKYLVQIFKSFMNLDDEHCYIYNNKWIIPNDKGLFLVVGILSESVIGNDLKYQRTTTELISKTSVLVRAHYSLDIFSYDTSARARQLEVIASLNSDIAVRYQDWYGFHIASNPVSFRDISDIEASKKLNRYNATISVLYGETFERSAPYWDKIGGYKTIIND